MSSIINLVVSNEKRTFRTGCSCNLKSVWILGPAKRNSEELKYIKFGQENDCEKHDRFLFSRTALNFNHVKIEILQKEIEKSYDTLHLVLCALVVWECVSVSWNYTTYRLLVNIRVRFHFILVKCEIISVGASVWKAHQGSLFSLAALLKFKRIASVILLTLATPFHTRLSTIPHAFNAS